MIHRIVLALAVITLLSGLVQVFLPGPLLGILSVENTATSRQLFATIGMFMAIIGGLLFQVLWTRAQAHVLVFWTGLQKFGASVAVSIGVAHGLFSLLALFIAGFDLLSGIVLTWYWASIRQETADKHTEGKEYERIRT